MRQRQHDRGVAVRARRDPFGVQEIGGVVAHRTDVAEPDARRLGLVRAIRGSYARPSRPESPACCAVGRPPNITTRSACSAILCQLVPGPFIACSGAEDVLHQHRAGGVAVGVARAGESTDTAKEALQLGARVMKSPGAAPSVRTRVDGVVAVLANHALELAGDQIERALPAHRDVAIGAASIARAAGPVARAIRRAPPVASTRLR